MDIAIKEEIEVHEEPLVLEETAFVGSGLLPESTESTRIHRNPPEYTSYLFIYTRYNIHMR